MNRFQTILAVLAVLLLASSALAVNEPYTWTISESSTDPFANSGAFVPGVQLIYLWLACCNLPDPIQDGTSGAVFGFVNKDPNNIIIASTAVNGFVNFGDGIDLILGVEGCPCGPVVAVQILVLNNFPAGYAIGPGFKGQEVTADCEPERNLYPIAWIGYSNTGKPPQTKGEICKEDPTPVDNSSFGQVKVLYR